MEGQRGSNKGATAPLDSFLENGFSAYRPPIAPYFLRMKRVWFERIDTNVVFPIQ